MISAAVARTFSNWNGGSTSRRGRQSQLPTLDPMITKRTLLNAYSLANDDEMSHSHRESEYHYTIH